MLAITGGYWHPQVWRSISSRVVAWTGAVRAWAKMGGFPMSGAEFFVEKWGALFEDPISKRWWITLAEGFLYVVNFEPDMRIRHHFCNYFFSYENQGRMGELTYRSGKQGLEDDFTSRHWLQCVFDLTLRWVKIAYPKVDSWSVFLTETCKLLWVIGSHW